MDLIERIYQNKINDLDLVYKEKLSNSQKERNNSLRASITPNKNNILIYDKADTIFFKYNIRGYFF